ncbi:MAG: hypothetical protein AVDCRST_MAG01-01-4252, partial [uncultured Rubrobacteraceae bacterium]
QGHGARRPRPRRQTFRGGSQRGHELLDRLPRRRPPPRPEPPTDPTRRAAADDVRPNDARATRRVPGGHPGPVPRARPPPHPPTDDPRDGRRRGRRPAEL